MQVCMCNEGRAFSLSSCSGGVMIYIDRIEVMNMLAPYAGISLFPLTENKRLEERQLLGCLKFGRGASKQDQRWEDRR